MARLGTFEDAVAALRSGGLACFPTETLWSLSCRADDPAAVVQVFAAKGRPGGVPLAVGFASWEAARAHVAVTPGAEALAAAFLPGPLSLVLHRTDPGLAHVAPGLGTLSVRVPDHPIAQAVLAAVGPLVMTSANRHGGPDPRCAEDVVAALGDVDAVVVEADPVPGTGSTVVDVTGDMPRILREGLIPSKDVLDAWPAGSSPS